MIGIAALVHASAERSAKNIFLLHFFSDFFGQFIEIIQHILGHGVYCYEFGTDGLGHGLRRAVVELLLYENHSCAVGFCLLDQIAKMLGRGRAAFDLHRFLFESVCLGQVAEGRVEDVKRAAAEGSQTPGQGEVGLVDFI